LKGDKIKDLLKPKKNDPRILGTMRAGKKKVQEEAVTKEKKILVGLGAIHGLRWGNKLVYQ